MARELAYFDTSALVKRYLEEAGSARARQLLDRYRVLSSVIAPVEALSALWRRQRAGEMPRADFEAILPRLHGDQDNWELVELDSSVRNRAQDVIRRTGVRTLDALHLASALLLRARTGAELPFITADRQQRGAASLLGMAVLWLAAR